MGTPEDVAAEQYFTPPEPFDPGTDLEVQNWHTQGLALKDYAEKRVIKSVEDLKEATNDLILIGHLKKAMQERRESLTRPLEEQKKAIIAKYKELMSPVEEADRITQQKMLLYKHEQDRVRMEQERINRLQAEAAEAQKKLTGEIVEVEKVEVVAEAPRRVSTDMGSAGLRDNWKYEVIDFAALPDTYKLPDAALLNSTAKKYHDQKQISGVRFFNEPIIQVNTR